MILSLAISCLAVLDSKPVLSLVSWKMDSSQTPGLSSAAVPPLPFLDGRSYPCLLVKLIFVGCSSCLFHFLDGPSVFRGPAIHPRLLFVESLGCNSLLPSSSNLCRGCLGGGELGCNCDSQSRVVRSLAIAIKRSFFIFLKTPRNCTLPPFLSSQWLENPV